MKNYKHNLASSQCAERSFIRRLKRKGFQIVGRHSPSDIVASKRGHKYYYEIKSSISGRSNEFFGSVSMAQLLVAFQNPHSYFFVTAKKSGKGQRWVFTEYSLKDFLQYVSPETIRFLFRIPMGGDIGTPKHSEEEFEFNKTTENGFHS